MNSACASFKRTATREAQASTTAPFHNGISVNQVKELHTKRLKKSTNINGLPSHSRLFQPRF